MNVSRFVLPLFLITTILAPNAFAQTDNSQSMERMDRLERDLQLLQRQVSRGGPVTEGGASGGDTSNIGGAAQLEVRLSTIEDQMRDLRGKVEQSEFLSRKNSEALDKLQRDVDFRFNELSGNAGAAAGATPAVPYAAPAATAPAPTAAPAPEEKPAAKPAAAAQPDPNTDGLTTAGDGVLRPPTDTKETPGTIQTTFSTPREHYNYAFRLLNQTQYEAASASFEAFTKKYPKDPLIGNAFYWQGETYYIRRDYVKSADSFRQGFEALPEGPKAADNLLKLAMSLNALSRDKEACLVLGQITTKFKKSSTSVTEKADQEQKRIGCSSKR